MATILILKIIIYVKNKRKKWTESTTHLTKRQSCGRAGYILLAFKLILIFNTFCYHLFPSQISLATIAKKHKQNTNLKKKLILLFIVIGLYFFWTGYLWKKFSCGIAGSYPCVETWNLPISETNLIDIIKEIKIEHPELEPPNVSYPTSNRHSYWYNITFYYPETKKNVYTWTRPNEDTTCTTIAFEAIATHIDSLTPINEIKMDRQEINRDFDYFANKKEIKKFESRILDLIKIKINEKQKNGSR